MEDTLAFMRGLKPGDKCFFMRDGYEEELQIVRELNVRGESRWARSGIKQYQIKFKRPHLKQHYYMDATDDGVMLQMSAKVGKVYLDWRKWRVVRPPV